MAKVRLRFAPSPTGPLHIGGVRTALYNYLYAKKMNGSFILRIEDTDQTRYTEGAEEYIIEALRWCGITFDEGPTMGGDFGPYRQSERKAHYHRYAMELIDRGHAYYAFDTPEELDQMRADMAEKGIHSAKYNFETRYNMRNSLTLSEAEVQDLIDKKENVTVRLKVPQEEEVTIQDSVRGDVTFNTSELDDKIILKADGMPTYHLANIVDDHLMEISHVIRGEEWLSSTVHHLLMYRFLDWKAPQYAHLPLILKPTGKGKLSKRDGAKFGFPVFPLSWKAENPEDSFEGFRERGFLPEALLNFLVLLGWNPGNDQEMFTLEEMIEAFSVDKIVKSGARFDFDKAKWFNQQYIIASADEDLLPIVKKDVAAAGYDTNDDFLMQFILLMKERVEGVHDFVGNAPYFFQRPESYDEKTVRKKYKEENREAFEEIADIINTTDGELAGKVKGYIKDNGYGFGAILPVLRVAITGSMAGPDLFEMMELIGREESAERVRMFLEEV